LVMLLLSLVTAVSGCGIVLGNGLIPISSKP
jgi:hypothetical protein